MPSKKKFVAIDGESYSTDDDHLYVLLADSSGEYVYKPDGLSTSECFRFLLESRRLNPKAIYVAFGLNYDVNMILKDIGLRLLKELWRDGKTSWYGYTIQWIPGKWFSVKYEGVSVRIYDVFGFFQKSFVNACKSWDIELPEDLEDMKQKRSVFDDDMKDAMIAYCINECEKLVELMDAMRDALDGVDLQPSSWVGAGSIASALMRREGVKDFHDHGEDWPTPVNQAILHAYFGGRVELFQQGFFPEVIDYDVCSAYPSQALYLPNLQNGTWRYCKRFQRDHSYSVWKVIWNVRPDLHVMPFPFRYKRQIYYPSSGSGWFHYPEVKKALEIYGDQITVEEGYVFQPSTEDRPFEFIRDQYAYRRDLKKAGHPSEKVLKLGLNAIYGKLAQGMGFRGQSPPFQSFYWAGRITSGTRARLLDISQLAPERLIMLATDGIFFAPPDVQIECSTNLGGMERSVFTNLFVAQAGVYHGYTEDGTEVAKSRGFFAKEIDFNAVQKSYNANGPTASSSYKSRRFVGLGSALLRNDRRVWRTWQESTRNLNLYPNRKFVADDAVYDGQPVRHTPPAFATDLMSEIYTPKGKVDERPEEALEFVSGMEQPMRDF